MIDYYTLIASLTYLFAAFGLLIVWEVYNVISQADRIEERVKELETKYLACLEITKLVLEQVRETQTIKLLEPPKSG